MQVPLINRAPMGSQPNGNGTLELRIRQVHQRRRRAFFRSIATVTLWSAGLLGAAAFVYALTVGVAQP